ncbi:hypothetical protein ACTWPB_22330 [Nocardia sp. IBHARD005]
MFCMPGRDVITWPVSMRPVFGSGRGAEVRGAMLSGQAAATSAAPLSRA